MNIYTHPKNIILYEYMTRFCAKTRLYQFQKHNKLRVDHWSTLLLLLLKFFIYNLYDKASRLSISQ